MSDPSLTPPKELVAVWSEYVYSRTGDDEERDQFIAERAAAWGADRELDACCEWVFQNFPWDSDLLRRARRPLVLKEKKRKALEALEVIGTAIDESLYRDIEAAILELRDE